MAPTTTTVPPSNTKRVVIVRRSHLSSNVSSSSNSNSNNNKDGSKSAVGSLEEKNRLAGEHAPTHVPSSITKRVVVIRRSHPSSKRDLEPLEEKRRLAGQPSPAHAPAAGSHASRNYRRPHHPSSRPLPVTTTTTAHSINCRNTSQNKDKDDDDEDMSVLEIVEEKRRLAGHPPPPPSTGSRSNRAHHLPPRRSPATSTTAPSINQSNKDDDNDMSVLEILEEKRWLTEQQQQPLQQQQQQRQPSQQQRQPQQRRPLPSCRTNRPSDVATTTNTTTSSVPAKTCAFTRVSSAGSDDSSFAVMPGAIAVRGSSANCNDDNFNDSDSDDDDDDGDGSKSVFPEPAEIVSQRHASSGYSSTNTPTSSSELNGVGDSGGVAIAIEVNEEAEEDAAKKMAKSVAVEFDPNAKPRPPFVKTKLFRKSALVLLIASLCVGAAVIAGILISVNDSANGTFYREQLGIQEEIEKIIGAELLESGSSTSSESSSSSPQLSPYAKALEWIIHQDKMQLVPSDANLLQRYITAYLYFSTTVNGPWRSCNPPVANSNEQDFCYHSVMTEIDYTRIEGFYDDVPANRWLTSLHECQFAGVVCDSDMQIRELRLNGANMSGSFPTGILHLPFLQVIQFGVGTLTGSLPQELIALKNLTVLELYMNQFSGEIPTDWWSSLDKIVRLNLSFNRIGGAISPQVRTLTSLDSLALVGNEISRIAPELGSLLTLQHLRLSRNKITGTIPTEIGAASKLKTLWLDHNLLTGTVPTEIGMMSKLHDFAVSKNTRLGGTIPDELYGLKRLKYIEMFSCNFTGSISPQIATMDLEMLNINDNSFTGTLPVMMAELQNLVYLEVQSNNFQGKMPEGFCRRIETDAGYSTQLVPHGLETMVADCAPDASTGAVKLSCDCCTKCCTAKHCVNTL